MSIVSTDLVAYATANMPASDSGTNGGAIDATIRVDFTQMSGSAEKVKFQSSSSSDTQNVTLVGRIADGTLTSETFALTGTSAKLSTANFERILSVTLASAAVGTITVSGNTSATTFRTIPVGEKGFRAIFQQIASSPSGTVTRYAKFAWKNTNGSLALTSAQVLENADPSGLIDHGLEGSLSDSTTATDRTTAPSGISFASTAANVANSQSLSSGAYQSVWLKIVLATNNAALKTTYTSEIDGQTT
jgi:hypothetical protein